MSLLYHPDVRCLLLLAASSCYLEAIVTFPKDIRASLHVSPQSHVSTDGALHSRGTSSQDTRFDDFNYDIDFDNFDFNELFLDNFDLVDQQTRQGECISSDKSTEISKAASCMKNKGPIASTFRKRERKPRQPWKKEFQGDLGKIYENYMQQMHCGVHMAQEHMDHIAVPALAREPLSDDPITLKKLLGSLQSV